MSVADEILRFEREHHRRVLRLEDCSKKELLALVAGHDVDLAQAAALDKKGLVQLTRCARARSRVPALASEGAHASLSLSPRGWARAAS